MQERITDYCVWGEIEGIDSRELSFILFEARYRMQGIKRGMRLCCANKKATLFLTRMASHWY